MGLKSPVPLRSRREPSSAQVSKSPVPLRSRRAQFRSGLEEPSSAQVSKSPVPLRSRRELRSVPERPVSSSLSLSDP
ncbi:hypothetical protein HF521_016894 [Silurus meridionalis]|uniref:Uncharacterized protein n=1 Tax=Silurus meridionalis TaxID=175797 RepID=A0A8T0BQI4_SILME|nr:hypothetical protein HF521_016894 [Silurus meridionalis]